MASKLESKTLINFVASRVASTTLDQAWSIALPLYLSSEFNDQNIYGTLVIAIAAGDFVAPLINPLLLSFSRVTQLAAICDISSIFLFIGIGIANAKSSIGIVPLTAFCFLCTVSSSLWFINSDAVTSNTEVAFNKNKLQKSLVLANNTGGVLGPIAGASLFKIVGLTGISFLNAMSFIWQLLSYLSISKLTSFTPSKRESISHSYKTSLQALRESRVMRYVALSSLAIKTLMLSLGFLIIVASGSGFDKSWIGLSMALLGIGVVLGNFIIQSNDETNYLNRYLVSTSVFPICLLGSYLGLLVFPNKWIFSFSLAFAGVCFGQYLLSFRMLRSQFENPHYFADLNAGAGFVARLGSLLGSLALPLFFNAPWSISKISAFYFFTAGYLIIVAYLMKRKLLKR